jgi:hypothetical protein
MCKNSNEGKYERLITKQMPDHSHNQMFVQAINPTLHNVNGELVHLGITNSGTSYLEQNKKKDLIKNE